MSGERWDVCDEGICIYDRALANRRELFRCIKHGAILGPAMELNNLDRKAARKALEAAGPRDGWAGTPEAEGWKGGRP